MSPQYDVHVQILQDILSQYMCSQTVPTENRIEMKTKDINFSLFYFHFNNVVDRHNTTALTRDKQYCRNGDFLNYWYMNREMVKRCFKLLKFSIFFFKRINKHKKQTKLYK